MNPKLGTCHEPNCVPPTTLASYEYGVRALVILPSLPDNARFEAPGLRIPLASQSVDDAKRPSVGRHTGRRERGALTG